MYCKECGKKLPFPWHWPICEPCYREINPMPTARDIARYMQPNNVPFRVVDLLTPMGMDETIEQTQKRTGRGR